jgi:AcrR family transcriptional regulator
MFTLFTMNDSKHRILACACDLYLADGFDGFSMRKLARAVGVTAPALYRHFESKEEVLLEVVGEAHDELFRTLAHALAGTTPEERFRMAGDAYLDFALAHPRYFQMIHSFTEFMGLDEVPEELARRTCSVGQFWHDRVRECIEAGMLKPDDPEGIGLVLWAHAYGLISLHLRGLLPLPEEAFRQVYADSFRRVLKGLGTAEYAAALDELRCV